MCLSAALFHDVRARCGSAARDFYAVISRATRNVIATATFTQKKNILCISFRLCRKLPKLCMIPLLLSHRHPAITSTPTRGGRELGPASAGSLCASVQQTSAVTRQQVGSRSPARRARTSLSTLVHTHICREPTMATTRMEGVDHAEDPLRTF